MTAPDLPMRERIAEALREAAASGHRAFTEWVSRDSDRDYLRGLDAVLTCDLRAMADRIGAGDE